MTTLLLSILLTAIITRLIVIRQNTYHMGLDELKSEQKQLREEFNLLIEYLKIEIEDPKKSYRPKSKVE